MQQHSGDMFVFFIVANFNYFRNYFQIIFQQKAIEILLEYGADINLRTNNDETVLDLCDDPDIREYIIQKSKEIESQQQQQAALAAMQKQMQLIYNTNSISNSTNSINESIKKSNADNSSIVNNSTRSLKRTSTGVSRRYVYDIF